MLINIIFIFSHNVFNPIKEITRHFNEFYFVVYQCFQFNSVMFCKELTLSQMTNFSSEFADNSFIFVENDKALQTNRKHCGKRRNFSFSHSVFKRLVLQTHKNQGLFGTQLINHLIKNLV